MDEINILLSRKKELTNDYGAKKITYAEFEQKLKEISDRILELNRKELEEKKVDEIIKVPEKLEKMAADPIMFIPTPKKRGRAPGYKAKIVKPVSKPNAIGIDDVMNFLKSQQKPKNTNKELKTMIIGELKNIKGQIIEFEAKIRKL